MGIESEALKYVLGLLQLLVGAWCYHLYSQQADSKAKLDSLQMELAKHKLHTSETFMTKSDSTRAFDALIKSLDALTQTVNARFDRVDEKFEKRTRDARDS